MVNCNVEQISKIACVNITAGPGQTSSPVDLDLTGPL